MTDARRRASLVAAAALALAAAWWLLLPAPIVVDAATVARGALRVTVDEEGEARVRDRYVVAAPTTGRLLRIALDEGDLVAAGDVVAQLEPAPLDPRDVASARARLEAAQATLRASVARSRRAEAALAKARRDAARAIELHRAGTLSTEAREQAKLEETSALEEREAARNAADAAQHDVEAAEAALVASDPSRGAAAQAQAPCGETVCVPVRAPVAGRVLRVVEESERIVPAGTPLVELGDPATLEIVVDVLSTDAVRIAPGARFLVADWGGEGTLEARVRRVEPSAFTKVSALGVEEQRVNVVADLLAPEPRLGDRYRVEARIVVWESEDELLVPASALFRTGTAWSVFAVEGGKARRRDVSIGAIGAYEAQVLGGLAAGDVVVLHPSDRVHDGTRVATR